MESWALTLVVIFGLIIISIASGLWISIGIGIVGVIVLLVFAERGLGMLGFLQFGAVNSFTLIALPLFTFMGYIMLTSRLNQRLYKGATSWVGWFPGGLLHTNIAACAVFGAVSGSSVATAATIGSVAIPELEKRGYSRKLIMGSLAAGGTLGAMIPPSIPLIIYGSFVEESIGRLFVAGIIPGLLVAALYMALIAIASLARPSLTAHRERFNLKAIVFSVVDILPVVALIFMVLGTIYLGVATPTESAAMGAVGAMFFCALFRKLTWKAVKEASLLALRLTSWVMLIVIGSEVVSTGLSLLRVPESLALWVSSLETSRIVVFVAITLMYILLGMFMDGLAMMLLTLPVTYPVMMSLGYSSVWFGIVMVIFLEMALITPPVGMNLFVINATAGGKYLDDVSIGSIPFFLMNVVALAIVYAFPDVVLWLPSTMVKAL